VRIALKRASLPSFGLAEHRAHQTVEQIDRLTREAGGEIEAHGDQRRVPTLTSIVGNMLNRHASGVVNELRHADLILDRLRKKGVRQLCRYVSAEGAKPEPRLTFDGLALKA
jgi:hypothetical protein